MAIKKRKKARGRPRIEGVAREPSGRISRSGRGFTRCGANDNEPIDLLALRMRAKHAGLSLEDAKNPLAATSIGRLRLLGREQGLSEAQYDAAEKYLQVRNNYLCAKGFAHGYYDRPQSQDFTGTVEEWVIKCTKRWQDARLALKEAQFDNPDDNLFAAIQYIVEDDMDVSHLVGALRLALNALSRHFLLDKSMS
ncbi:hypothetical protein [Bartonella sp. DGB2]|uniref:hypothetical protein n=2 Tax=Bartonella sp. DGB2 TaxID=3388426 RepID=UPI0039901621